MGVTLGVVSLLGSLASSSAQNSASRDALQTSSDAIKRDYTTQIGQLTEQAQSANDAVGLEMTNARFDGLKDTATTSNVLVEREIAGNTATKLYEQSNINQNMTHNALAKKAEDNMVKYGVEMENSKHRANNALLGAGAQAEANSVSGLEATTKAVGAGVSGYSAGSSLGSVFGSTTTDTSLGAFSNMEVKYNG